MAEGSSSEGDPLPKPSDVLAGIEGTKKPSEISRPERRYLAQFTNTSVASQTAYAHLKGTQDHYRHKGTWSWFLMGCVGGMIVFQSVLLVLVGLGQLDFSQYEWLLPALLIQNLGQVIGLAVYAVKFLFSDISKSGTE